MQQHPFTQIVERETHIIYFALLEKVFLCTDQVKDQARQPNADTYGYRLIEARNKYLTTN
jgi:hypothetical protein